MSAETFDVAIIGGGPAGYVAGIRGAQLGGRVCVIEERELGGVCLNRGCIPTKALVASVRALRTAREAASFGVMVSGDVAPDLPAMMARKNKVVEGLVKGIQGLFKSNGVIHIKGRASFLGPGKLQVEGPEGRREIGARKVIVATGSRPAELPGLPLDGKNVITSDEALELKAVPESILIVGAGYIGCEWACIFRELGSEVTLVEVLPRILPLVDEDMAKTLEREFKKNKIAALTGKTVEKLSPNPQGGLVARLSGGEEVGAEIVLVSVGRAYNTEGLGLEGVGVELGENGAISVNERMETTAPDIYAAGDVVGGMLLAHVASAEGMVAAANALGGEERMSYDAIPSGIFTLPEIGTVGLSESQAREAGQDLRVGRCSFRALGKAHALGETVGEVKIVADAETEEILGVHIIGAHAADLVHEAALAMRNELTIEEIVATVHAHPTMAEALMEAAHAVHGRAIHLPKALH